MHERTAERSGFARVDVSRTSVVLRRIGRMIENEIFFVPIEDEGPNGTPPG